MTEIERRETGLTVADAERLQEAAIAGDAAAQRRLDAEATSEGYADFDAMMETIMGGLFATVDAALGKTACSGGNLTDDPAYKTIKAAYARSQNDPAIRAALRAARELPVLHLVRMTREEALAGHDTAVTQPEAAMAVTHAVVNRLAGVVTDTARRQAWDYTRQTEGDRVVFTFYGQGQHFEGVRQVIGLAIVAPPGSVQLSQRFEFSKSRADVKADYEARGLDPALVNHPEIHPYGLPEKEEMLSADVILAADHQFKVIAGRLREELERAERGAAVTQAEADALKMPKGDEDLRLAQIAEQYSKKGAGRVMPDSITMWEKIANYKQIGLTDSKITERIPGLSLRNLRYHKERMKNTGYWHDQGLD